MAQYDGKVTISTALDNSGFKSGVNHIKGSLGGLKGVLGKLGIAVSAAFAVKKLVEFGAACVKLGSDVAEVQNVVDVAFGSMSSKMEQFADTAITTYGMSKLAAKKTGSNYMAMAKGMGVASDAASDMAANLTGLSGDVASFYNMDQTEAATKLKSVFTGETESLKEIGVVMTQASLQQYALTHGMSSNIAAMSQAELVALRYAFVMDSLALAQGDFARTQDSWANKTRILSMQWQEFMSIIGQALTTILLPLVKVLNTIVSALIRMANAFNAAIQTIFGGSRTVVAESGGAAAADDLAAATGSVADSSGAAAAGQDALADSTKAAAAAAKKSLTSFDELNVLQDSSDGGGAGGNATGGGATSDTISTSEIGNAENKLSKLQEFLNQLKDSFSEGVKLGWGDAGEGVQNILSDLGKIKASLQEIFTDPDVTAAAGRFSNSVIKTLGTIVGAVASIGVSIAENLVGGFARYLDSNKEFIKGSLTAIFNVGADLSDMIGGAAAGIATVFRSLGSEGGKNLMAGLMGVLNNSLLGMIQTFGQTLYTILNTCLFGPFTDNADKIREVFSNLFAVVAPLFEGIAQGIGDFYTALNQFYQSVIRPAAEYLETIFSEVLGGALDNLNDLLEKLTGTEDVLNNIGQVLGWLVGGITAVAAAFGAIKVALGIFAAIQGAIGLVTGAIAGIGSAFAGIGTIMSGVMGTASLATGAVSATGVAVGLLSNPVGIAIAAIGALVAAGVFLYSNWDTIKEKAGQLGEWVQSVWSDTKENVGAAVDALKTDVETKWQTLSTNVSTTLTIFQVDASALWSGISTTAGSLVSGGVSTVQGLWSGMCSGLQTKLSEFSTAASGIWSGINTTTGSLVSGGVSTVQGLWSGMCSALGSLMSNLRGMFSSVWSAITSSVSNAVRGIINTVQGMITTIRNAISSVMSALSSLGSRASSAVSSARSAASSVFSRSADTATMATFSSMPVPALASGAVIPPNKKFLAMLGDQTNGTNIEAPLDTIKQAVAEEINGQMDTMMAGFEAVVAAIQRKNTSVIIGDDVIYASNSRQESKVSMMKGE